MADQSMGGTGAPTTDQKYGLVVDTIYTLQTVFFGLNVQILVHLLYEDGQKTLASRGGSSPLDAAGGCTHQTPVVWPGSALEIPGPATVDRNVQGDRP